MLYLNNIYNGLYGMIGYITKFRRGQLSSKRYSAFIPIERNFKCPPTRNNAITRYEIYSIIKSQPKFQYVPSTYSTHYSTKHKFDYKDIRGPPNKNNKDILCLVKYIMYHDDNINILKSNTENLVIFTNASTLHSSIYAVIDEVIKEQVLYIRNHKFNLNNVYNIVSYLNTKVIDQIKIYMYQHRKYSDLYYRRILQGQRKIVKNPEISSNISVNQRRIPRNHTASLSLQEDIMEKNKAVHYDRPKIPR